jgi:hypothetical protein
VQQDGSDEDVDWKKRLTTGRDTLILEITYKHRDQGKRRGRRHNGKRGPGR